MADYSNCFSLTWTSRHGYHKLQTDESLDPAAMVILIGFIIAQFIYTIFLRPIFGYNLILFLGVLVLVLYLFVILPLPEGHNEMIDVFKEYAKGGAIILGGDSLLMLSSALVALLYMSQPDYVVASCSIVVTYALTYILYTKRRPMTRHAGR